MKNILIIIINLIIFIPFSSFSQTNEELITSLEKELSGKVNLNREIEIYTELANMYLDNNLAESYENVKELEKKLKWKSKKINKPLQIEAYEVIGQVYSKKLNPNEAIKAFEAELVILQEIGTPKEIFAARYNLAALAFKSDNYNEANKYYEQLLVDLENSDNNDLLMLTYKALYTINIELKNPDKALMYLEKYIGMNDAKFFEKVKQVDVLEKNYKVEQKIRLNTENKLQYTENVLEVTENVLEVTDSALKEVTLEKIMLQNDTLKKSLEIKDLAYETLKKENQLQLQQAETKFQAEQSAKRQRTIFFLIGLVSIILIAGFLVFSLYRKIKKQNQTLTQQKVEIQAQKDEIVEKNTQITESIFYARRLQTSILIPESIIQNDLPNLFIYYSPRDIVSGDFYWFTKFDKKYILSAIDCTGHGVPGAFLSMIGNTLLNKIVKENKVTSPAEILNQLHLGMTSALQQNTLESETEDGMDMTLVTISPAENKFTVAAAKNSLVLINEDKIELVPSDFHSIGEKPLRPGFDAKFNNHEFEYSSLTSIYMMTDGYGDQFGGDDDKKFGFRNLKAIFEKNHLKSSEVQKEIITNTMKDWIGERGQTDDMLIIGLNMAEIKA